MAEAPGVQNKCGRGMDRGKSNLGTPMSWVKAHRSQSHTEVAWVPTSRLCSHTGPAAPRCPGAKHSDLGFNASSFLFSTPPTQMKLYSRWDREGCLGLAGFRESVASCQAEEGKTEVKSRVCVLSPGTFQTFQDVGAS